MERISLRMALLAGSGLVLTLAGPASAQEGTADCLQRIDRIEQQLRQAEIGEEQRREADNQLRDARSLAQAGNQQECVTAASRIEERYLAAGSGAGTTQQSSTAQAEIQGAANTEVMVEQPAPQVTIRQAQPVVEVNVPEPEVSVQVPEPVVTVRMPEPVIHVEMPEPVIRVEMPEPQVDVQQQDPQVTVNMPEPEVSVTQPEPEVAVRMPEPQIEIDQPQPDVQVAEAEPEVTVQQAEPDLRIQQAEPKVNVQRSEPRIQFEQAEPRVEVSQAEPRVEVTRAGDTGQQQSQQQQQQLAEQQDQPQDDAQLQASPEQEIEPAAGVAGMAPDEIVGSDVVNSRGESIAEIGDVVRQRGGGQDLYAVLNVGGFLGLAEKEVAIELSEFQRGEDGNLVLPQATEQQLESMPEYDVSAYESAVQN